MSRLDPAACPVVEVSDKQQVHCAGQMPLPFEGDCTSVLRCCSKITEAEAAVSVNEKKLLVMHMHMQLKLDEY